MLLHLGIELHEGSFADAPRQALVPIAPALEPEELGLVFGTIRGVRGPRRPAGPQWRRRGRASRGRGSSRAARALLLEPPKADLVVLLTVLHLRDTCRDGAHLLLHSSANNRVQKCLQPFRRTGCRTCRRATLPSRLSVHAVIPPLGCRPFEGCFHQCGIWELALRRFEGIQQRLAASGHLQLVRPA